MRLQLTALAVLSAVIAVAPGVAAFYQPPPICPACTVLVAIVAQCTQAELAQLQDGGAGCAVEDQQEQCVVDEADQDVFNAGDGCDYVNWRQHDVDCQADHVEGLVGLGDGC